MEFKRVPFNRIELAITCFAEAMAVDWPYNPATISSWVRDEFYQEDAEIICSEHAGKIVAVCMIAGFVPVFCRIEAYERSLVKYAVQHLGTGYRKSEMIYMGGLGIDPRFRGNGRGVMLIGEMKRIAHARGGKIAIARTANTTELYPRIHSLEYHKKQGWRELILPGRVFYENVPGLERKWIVQDL